MSEDAKTLIEQAVRSFLDEVPALKPLKLVVGVDLRGRGDTQQFRVQLPELDVRKDIAADARVRVDMRRDFFNAMVQNGARVADWREAFEHGQAKATGVDQYMKLIVNVVEHLADDPRAERRMLAHHRVLRSIEPDRLEQHPVGHADLADVVQQPGLAQPLDAFVRPVARGRQARGERRHAVGVLLGGRVLRVNGAGE